ncbi:DUF4169 family protein [Yoonia sp.]|uniref:DUF4169 family protein n=1 Tax=Yoonia sp. TaxID=2212373 RepID=UPI002FD8F522
MKPVNLNKLRKAKAKGDAKAKADENAIRFGRSKAEKAADTAREARRLMRLEQHKRDG